MTDFTPQLECADCSGNPHLESLSGLQRGAVQYSDLEIVLLRGSSSGCDGLLLVSSYFSAVFPRSGIRVVVLNRILCVVAQHTWRADVYSGDATVCIPLTPIPFACPYVRRPFANREP